MSEPQIDDAPRVCTVNLETELLRDGKLNLCIVQTAPCPLEIIKNDGSRPCNVAAVVELLTGGNRFAGPVLDEIAPGREPTLILLPEYALGSSDWAAIDAAVRASPVPVVLIAGFGATKGEVIVDWAGSGADDGTRCRLTWDRVWTLPVDRAG